MKKISQGAEAVIYSNGKKAVKERVKKEYRISAIDDRLRKLRTRQEGKLLKKVDFAPEVFSVDEKEMKIEMEHIDGFLIKDLLDGMGKNEREEVCLEIGKHIGVLHSKDIIHGDLTTSNMILSDKKVKFIDFGLGFISSKVENKAVDINLLKHALESKHHEHFEGCFENVLRGYKQSYDLASEVVKRLEKVDARGRYKSKK